MLKLFYTPGTCSLASHIALEEAGAGYEVHRVDFSKAEQTKPDYLTINPKGRVPALVTDRGILTETPAILAYIAQSFPKARLAPLDDPFEFARLQSFLSYLCSTVHVAHAHARRAARWADDAAAQEAMKAKVPQNMADCFALIERTMFVGPFVRGDAYSVADPYLFTIAGWLESDGVDPARFPRILDHRNRMAERPAVAKVLAEVQS
ncbi:glutathione S-transferase family protein [Sinorhizobium meliloti WSM1022]|jgi:glutathione S-transferase|uniref:glutathione S-transferase family protein n=1 Tax=Rhizobium meliloti TaxID=382 RepID=UPI0003FC410D|nr:glutathione S-transferase family protein [Sinorhizobium meliloti]ASQ04722.1 glutathione S-transferase family protein [Sinorhizobium meliloti]MCO6420628.1 glutathione S-transferase family protein [Sinorhizobium meliloti]MDW9410200.1 glutathione S-transferase [Sinorhizobium meliloti]MDW9440382.1 glutathione S-transferase [Sinorhizobium meliloti]MDW9455481.1 glutathione S-transferase [Sinorhizobium meliloti]